MSKDRVLPEQNILQSLVDAHPEPFALVDREYRVIAANQRYAETYAGLNKQDVVGMKCHQVSHKTDTSCEINGEECPLKRVFETGDAYQVIHRHFDAHNHADYVAVHASPIRNDQGEVVLIGESVASISHDKDLCFDMDRIVTSGCCPSFMRAMDNLVTLAATDAPILILGETGTGKEMAAQLIHRKSGRFSKEFVAIDCTQFSEETFVSELFGHLRGAFTGAVENKIGLFELADGGTLFLDEIGELSMSIQARLLRALETGRFRRLGETRERQSNVRLVCATNRDLKQMVGEGAFRADLYYRINCMQVELPPLRHRRQDLPEFIDYFLARAGHVHGISPAARTALLSYSFPGNVREMRNILERAAALAKGGRVEVAHLPPEVLNPALAVPISPLHDEHAFFHVHETPHDAKQSGAAILEVLARHGGNRRLAAEELGITERTLYRRLKALTGESNPVQADDSLS
ncbi:MAG: sigma 54-interacting transcriptional regulator [Pseudomonadota bacterium]